MEKTEIATQYDLIAERVKPGDRWRLVNDHDSVVHKSLTDVLEAWFSINQEEVSFRLDPLDSKLYAIRTEEVEIKPEPIKTFSIYGEYSQTSQK
tara:strand:- start:2548 stop:2829 length:282 start_codon:yes stop_codon:yes gene_type:complete